MAHSAGRVRTAAALSGVARGLILSRRLRFSGSAGPRRRMCAARCSNAGNGRPRAATAAQIPWVQAADHRDDVEGDMETAVRAMKGGAGRFSSKNPSMTKDSSSRSTPHWAATLGGGGGGSWPVTAKAWPPPSGSPVEPARTQVLDALVAGRSTQADGPTISASAQRDGRGSPRPSAGATRDPLSCRSDPAGRAGGVAASRS